MIVLKGDRLVKSGEQPAHDSEIERLTAEVERLKERVTEPSQRIRALESRVVDLKSELAGTISRNERLSGTLRGERTDRVAPKRYRTVNRDPEHVWSRRPAQRRPNI